MDDRSTQSTSDITMQARYIYIPKDRRPTANERKMVNRKIANRAILIAFDILS
jgi:hypothetical protein